MKRAAVIVHPRKHHDLAGFRAGVTGTMTGQGWAEPFWLETSPDDTGERLARMAVAPGSTW